jgi:hypothetical protein
MHRNLSVWCAGEGCNDCPVKSNKIHPNPRAPGGPRSGPHSVISGPLSKCYNAAALAALPALIEIASMQSNFLRG